MTLMIRQDGEANRTEHVDVPLKHSVYLAIMSLAIAKHTTKSELISNLVEDTPIVKKELQEIESEPDSVLAISRETIESSS